MKNKLGKIEKKQEREQYDENNVIYMLTTKEHKEKRTYIIGKTGNLKNRLSTYNKTLEHEVVYYKQCGDKDTMDLIERTVLHHLNEYRESANRERVILPIDKDISYFIEIIDYSITSVNKYRKTNKELII